MAPDVSITSPAVDIDAPSVEVQEPDVNVTTPELDASAEIEGDLPKAKSGGFGFKLPKVKFPSLKGRGKAKGPELDAELDAGAANVDPPEIGRASCRERV